jgi:hypothetical protein
MKYCITCLQPDTRPNTRFNAEGMCPACAYHDTIQNIDWGERFEIAQTLIANYKRTKNFGFDCIIGVSGGKDSTRQALYVRDKLGMHPLLVSLSNPPQQVSRLGVTNVSNLIELGFNVVLSSPAPETWRRLIHDSFFQFTNWARSSELALFSSVPQIAIRYGIPLIFWGENPALQVGDLNTMGQTGFDGNNLRYSNTLSSGHEWMLQRGYVQNEILPYLYPNEAECNLDEDWHNLNQMIKYFKFGFGKVTEYVNEAMRDGLLDRNTAINLVEQYDGMCSPIYIQSFCKFIGITEEIFWNHVRKSTNRDLFNISNNGKITRKFEIGIGL